jgi:hypothetical protein
MDESPIALILAHRAALEEGRSALPNAPVVPHVAKVPVLGRTRKTVASGLRHLADAVAPARPVRTTTARAGLRREAC